MANMSYCRFENTLTDLNDCAHALNNAMEDGESMKSFTASMTDYERQAVRRFGDALRDALEVYEQLEAADELEAAAEDEESDRRRLKREGAFDPD